MTLLQIIPTPANHTAVPPSPAQHAAPAEPTTVEFPSKPKHTRPFHPLALATPTTDPSTGLSVVPVKRGRGRPRKYPLVIAATAAAPIAGTSTSKRPGADDRESLCTVPEPADRSLVVRLASPTLATLAPTSERPPSRAGVPTPPKDSPPAPHPSHPPPQSLSEHLQQTLRKHRPCDSSMSLSPVMHQRSRHESAEESSTGSTPVESLSSGSSVSSPASASEPGEADGKADAWARCRARPRTAAPGVKGPSGQEKRERRLEEKRRTAEMRGPAGGRRLRRSTRGVPAVTVAEGVLGAVKELCI